MVKNFSPWLRVFLTRLMFMLSGIDHKSLRSAA